MLDLKSTKIYSTEMNGRTVSILVGFRPAERASGVHHFHHKEIGTAMRIFSDRDGMPIAVQFTRYPDVFPEIDQEASSLGEVDREGVQEAMGSLYEFAVKMIELSQIKLGGEIIKEMLLSKALSSIRELRSRRTVAS